MKTLFHWQILPLAALLAGWTSVSLKSRGETSTPIWQTCSHSSRNALPFRKLVRSESVFRQYDSHLTTGLFCRCRRAACRCAGTIDNTAPQTDITLIKHSRLPRSDRPLRLHEPCRKLACPVISSLHGTSFWRYRVLTPNSCASGGVPAIQLDCPATSDGDNSQG